MSRADGQKIKALLREKNITQVEFARRMELSAQQISYLLNGKREWRKPHWDRAAIILGVSPGELYDDEVQRSRTHVALQVTFTRGEYLKISNMAKQELRDVPNLIRFVVMQWLAEKRGSTPDRE